MINNDIWDRLGNSAAGATGVVALRLHPESKFDLFAALDKSTGRRFVILKSDDPDLHPGQSLPTGRGFRVQYLKTADDSEGNFSLQLELLDLSFAEIFDIVSNDVLQNVLQCANDKSAFRIFVSKIVEWQHFLDQLPKDGLSEQEQQGLFAELWFLREYLIGELGPERAISSWAGPEHQSKDFQFTEIAIEVKSSSAKQHSSYAISNEMQLDSRNFQRVLLFCLLLEKQVAGGKSLNELITEIRELLLDPIAAVRFSELLLKYGYVDSESGHYNSHYTVRSQHIFDVRDDFPRIIESDLRRGVGEVRYSIEHSACEHFAVSEAEMRRLLQAIIL